jgi:hypothetical protein
MFFILCFVIRKVNKELYLLFPGKLIGICCSFMLVIDRRSGTVEFTSFELSADDLPEIGEFDVRIEIFTVIGILQTE